MIPEVRNLFTTSLCDEGREVFHHLLEGESFSLEAITSRGKPSAEGFWYDQSWAEWVLLLRGKSSLEFEESLVIHLLSGDYLLIPAHCRHRVASVSEDAVWLALHLRESASDLPPYHGGNRISGD